MMAAGEITLSAELSHQLGQLYGKMETAYETVARAIGHTCRGCPDNCCDSFFLHHTYAEWAYLWEAMREMPGERREKILTRAREYVLESEKILANRGRPAIMCPANEEGLCAIYSHRLLVCRLHGVPASITRPDGVTAHFPGCFRCQEKTAGREKVPVMDRTALFREMVLLETKLLGGLRLKPPKIKMTLAKMLVLGPPVKP